MTDQLSFHAETFGTISPAFLFNSHVVLLYHWNSKGLSFVSHSNDSKERFLAVQTMGSLKYMSYEKKTYLG